MLSLPVNTEIAQVRGHDGYGFPKRVTGIDASPTGERVSTLTSSISIDGRGTPPSTPGPDLALPSL
ncbi:hypothetical protein ACQEU3_39995 [Spirillospora sp. CA-253888]